MQSRNTGEPVSVRNGGLDCGKTSTALTLSLDEALHTQKQMNEIWHIS